MSNLSLSDELFQAPYAPKPVFRPGLRWGAYSALPCTLVGWGGEGTSPPIPFPSTLSASRSRCLRSLGSSWAPSKKNSWLRLCNNEQWKNSRTRAATSERSRVREISDD